MQHIQTFVALGPPAGGPESDSIVIDDEIEIGSADYSAEDDAGTQIAVRPPMNSARWPQGASAWLAVSVFRASKNCRA